jgi:hypothetical protein
MVSEGFVVRDGRAQRCGTGSEAGTASSAVSGGQSTVAQIAYAVTDPLPARLVTVQEDCDEG